MMYNIINLPESDPLHSLTIDFKKSWDLNFNLAVCYSTKSKFGPKKLHPHHPWTLHVSAGNGCED